VHEVDPNSRIEGHLGVKVVVNPGTGKIVDANAHGNLLRGFENFLLGRDINDAITFVQRICGVCPVPHGMTSTYCVDNVLGYSKGHITFAVNGSDTYGVPKKAVLIRNLVLGVEFLMSSITHFYHLAAPSYVQGPAIPPWTPYFDTNYYAAPLLNPTGTKAVPNVNPTDGAQSLWDAVIYSYVKALKIRRMTFEAGSLFAGRMPMTSCYVGGGVTNDGTEDLTKKIALFRSIVKDIAAFVVSEYVPIVLALGALYPAFDSQTNTLGFLPGTTNVPRGSGAGVGRFLAWGGFPDTTATGALAQPGGVYDASTAAPSGFPATGSTTGHENVTHFRVMNKAEVEAKFLTGGTFSVPNNLTEDISNSRYGIAAGDAAAYAASANTKNPHPGVVTRTKPNRSNGYTYLKSPRWHGGSFEVGPLARMVVAGYYPINGTSILAFPFATTIYVNAGHLDTRVIDANIANGLSNTNLDGTVTAGTGNLLAAVAGFIETCNGGLSTIDRLRARAMESLVMCINILGTPAKSAGGVISWPGTDGWLTELAGLPNTAGSTWRQKSLPLGVVSGWGGTEAPRGALMHMATIKVGKIQRYQCIVPTTWNGSPKDGAGVRGAIEEAMIGAAFASDGATFVAQGGTTVTTAGGVEVLRIAQSFDPCIACAIH
jgi:Ni,Fe-hydrogenase I large subunit